MKPKSKHIIIIGTVVHGNAIGRSLGFPTANIVLDEKCEVESGVYGARVSVDGRRFGAMANLGRRPTVGDCSARLLEVNIFGLDEDLYGKNIEVELIEYIREERKFESLDELKKQIDKDREIIKKTLE